MSGDRLTVAQLDALVAVLMTCEEPISTGIFDGAPMFDPCGRKLHLNTGVCKYHARGKGLIPRAAPPSVAARAAQRRPKRQKTAEEIARAATTTAQIRRLRRAAAERRRRGAAAGAPR